jgi:uncharacterized protein
MKIFIDGDACPNAIKKILFRAAERTQTQLILVANQFINIPPSPFIKRWMVDSGFDKADNKIIDSVEKDDLVITADIPLADSVIDKKAIALDPRGQLYSPDNIKQILSRRNFNATLRDSGLLTGGAPPLSQKEIQQFSNHLDRILTQHNN